MDSIPLGMGVALLFPLGYVAVIFLTVYWAVRLGIRHEKAHDAKLGR